VHTFNQVFDAAYLTSMRSQLSVTNGMTHRSKRIALATDAHFEVLGKVCRRLQKLNAVAYGRG
jgi:hypothetical protein